MSTTSLSPGVQDSRRSCAELGAAIMACESIDDAMRLLRIAQTLSLEHQECVDLALARAEQLNGVQHVDGYR